MTTTAIGPSLKASSSSSGYTLIELLAVLAILSILMLAVWPLAEMTAEREREHDLKQALWEIRDAIDAYKKMADLGAVQGAASGFPPNLHVLADGAVDHRSGAPIYFLRHIPRDPFADSGIPAEQTWGLRSYASSPSQPQAGQDVYDIFSKSTAIGLDGTPVSQW